MIKRKEKSSKEIPTETKSKKLKTQAKTEPKKVNFEKKTKPLKSSSDKKKPFKPNSAKGKPLEQKPEDWNVYKKKKKELRLKRKQAKSDFDVIAKAKQIGEKLRCKNLKGGEEERNKLINELHSLLKGKNHYAKFVLAHDTSRIVQWLLKYSSDLVKNQISQELIPVSVEMLQSKYGIFCAKRLLKYGNHQTRNEIINKMYGSVVKLTSHAISAPVFELAYSTWASPQQKQHLIQEFFGEIYRTSKDNNIKHLKDIFKQSPDMKSAVLSTVKANLSRIIDKSLLDSGLVQTVLNQYLSECSNEERADLISQLIPHIVVISNSKDGARAAMQCIWYGSNKDRKQAMKIIKEHVIELAKHEHGHCSIITLLDTADDTVLLHKIILNEILKSAKELAENEWGRKVLLWLVAPAESTCFHPLFVKELEEGRKNSNSKKDPQIRRKEILGYSIETLMNLIRDDPDFWLKNSSLAYEMLAVLKAGEGDILKSTLENIVNVIVNPNWTIKNNEQDVLGIEDAGLHMVLKKLAKHDQNIENENSRFGASLVNSLTDETIKKWLPLNRGCFLLVAVYENSSTDIQNLIKEKLGKHTKLLKKQSTVGGKILLKKVTE